MQAMKAMKAAKVNKAMNSLFNKFSNELSGVILCVCVRLCGDYLGVMSEVFWEDFESKTSLKKKKERFFLLESRYYFDFYLL